MSRSFLVSGAFWVATIERGVRTFAWTAAGLLGATGVDKATDTTLVSVDWQGLLVSAGIAALAAVLFSIGVAKATDGSPAINSAEKVLTNGARIIRPETTTLDVHEIDVPVGERWTGDA